jgi:hypothetical protein
MRRFKLGAVGVLCGLALLLPVNSYAALVLDGDTPQQALAAFVAAGPSGVPLTYSANFTFTIIPEPAPLALVGISLLGLGLFRLRRPR